MGQEGDCIPRRLELLPFFGNVERGEVVSCIQRLFRTECVLVKAPGPMSAKCIIPDMGGHGLTERRGNVQSCGNDGSRLHFLAVVALCWEEETGTEEL